MPDSEKKEVADIGLPLDEKVKRSSLLGLKLARRSFLSSLGVAGLGWFGSGKLNALAAKGAADSRGAKTGKKVDGDPIVAIKSGFGSTGDVYAELGVTPVIGTGIGGLITVIGGSVMAPEVMEVSRLGNEYFLWVDDLEVAAGKFIAKVCKSPAGYTGTVTSGAAASILVGIAGMLTEDYEQRLEAIPDLTHFPKSEVIIQAAHRNAFDHQIRQLGVKLVVVNTKEEMVAAINPRTVCIYTSQAAVNRGQVSNEEVVRIAREHNVYTYCDTAADIPPKSLLWELPALGFDMVGVSGGKYIHGPQSSGILIGKEKLIGWALQNMSPQDDRIGRPCKVGKEQIFGALKALEMFVNNDDEAEIRMYDARAQLITDALTKFGVTANRVARPGNFPRYSWKWDGAKINLTGKQIQEQLAATRPVAIGYVYPDDYQDSHGKRGRLDPNWPVALDPNRYGLPNPRAAGAPPPNPNTLSLSFNTIKEGQTEIIAKRLVEIFSTASRA